MKRHRALTSFSAALTVFLTVGAAAAYAHAMLLRADPAPEAVLGAQPSVVRLWFNEAIEIGAGAVTVLDPLGRRVEGEASVSSADPTLLEAGVRGTEPGTYTVRWTVLSEDGHPASGAYGYSVERATASSPEVAQRRSHTALLAASRLVHLVGLTLALGALALMALVGTPTSSARRTLAGMGLVGAVVVVVAAPLGLFAQAVAMGGAAPDAPVLASLTGVLAGHWGRWWMVRATGSLGLLTVFALLMRGAASLDPLRAGALLSALVLLAGTSANGHAMTTDPVWLSVPVDMLHLIATGAWLGGLGGVLILLRASRSRAGVAEGGPLVDLRSLVPRFSTLALVCVQVLIVTGLYQTWAHVSRPALLASTAYGQTLLVKLGLLALIAAPAAFNRFVLKPRLSGAGTVDAADQNGLVRRFTKVIGIEAGVGALVLAAAALLSALPPAQELPSFATASGASVGVPPPAASSGPPARVWSATSADKTLLLSLDPALTGSNQVRLSVRDASGRPVDGGALRLRVLAPSASGVANAVVQLGRAGLEYECLLTLAAAGEWTLEVLLSESESVSFRVEVAASIEEHAAHPPEATMP